MANQEKVVLITGASRRLGQAMAFRLAQEGYTIALHYRSSEEDAKQTQLQIQKNGGVCHLFQADLHSRDACIDLIDRVKKEVGVLSVLINNASVFYDSAFADTDEMMLEEYLQIHFKTPFWLSQSFAKQVKQGNIINMLDSFVVRHSERFFTYLITKKMLKELTIMLARVLAPTIRVNAIAPGSVLPALDFDEVFMVHKKQTLPMQQTPTLDDIAQAALHILEQPYLTGHIMYVDGGEQLT